MIERTLKGSDCYYISNPHQTKAMLDYKVLRKKFTEELNSYDRDSLLKWKEEDDRQVFFAMLSKGTILIDEYTTKKSYQITDPSEIINSGDEISGYALAA